jgi:hypothetical protein
VTFVSANHFALSAYYTYPNNILFGLTYPEIAIKTLLLITSLTLVSHTSFANISDIDAAANTMNITELSQYSEQAIDYEKAYADYRLAITANIIGQRQLATNSLNNAQQTP